MSINKLINQKLNKAIKESYLTKQEFLRQLNCTLDSVCIGTGKSLLQEGQPQADIKYAKENKFPHYNKANEELSIKALKANPSTWFVYVPCQSLAKPLSIHAFDKIMYATIQNSYYPYGLEMNRQNTKDELEHLVA